jgi:hypothetical protein
MAEFVDPDAPLRLEVAAKIAFPQGGITVSGLRREIARGRLEAEEIAGKYFTTLANIKRMREKCRVSVKARASGNARHDAKAVGPSPRPSGSLKTQDGISPQAALLAQLKQNRQERPSKP